MQCSSLALQKMAVQFFVVAFAVPPYESHNGSATPLGVTWCSLPHKRRFSICDWELRGIKE
eukprot:2775226-Pyramimonas_sp.AAC.1